MANLEQRVRLRLGVKNWNQWREKNPSVRIDLSGANLSGTNLSGANLSGTNLSGTNLSGTNLSGTNLGGAFLSGTNLIGANLSGAFLSGTNLIGANLGGASLIGADLIGAKLGGAFLRNANLNGAKLGGAFLRSANLSGANLSGTNLRGAHFNGANLGGAILRGADLSGTNLSGAFLIGADLSDANLIGAHFNGANFSGADFSGTNFSDAILSDANLRGTNLRGTNLSRVDFIGANLSDAILSDANFNGANLIGANLSGADLTASQALGTNLSTATLTGACIEDWNTNSRTNLQEVICEYIFTRYDDKQRQFTDRRPHDLNQIFAPGEFTKRYQVVLESVELFFNDGIDWKAFLVSLQDLQAQYGDELSIQTIGRKAGDAFIVQLEVPPDVDKGAIERAIKESYEAKLQIVEAQYRVQLQAKDHDIESYRRESVNMTEIARLLASRPINVEAKAVAENRSSSENYNTTVHGNVGNIANKMQGQASQQVNQYIGANLNEIAALIQSLRGIAESFPQEQRTEAIEHLEDLETDLKQPPEQRKQSRMKAALVALMGVATIVSGAVAGANEFVTQVQELSDKLGIPLPIEQVQPQSPQKNAIDVKAIGSD